MANYATQADLETNFGDAEVLRTFDREASRSLADATVIAAIAAALLAATEEIDTYLAVRYDLPLAATPGVLMRVCCNLAMYYGSIGSDSMTEDKQTRYDQRIKWLDKVSKGTVTLGPEEEEVEVQDDMTLSTDSEDRLFSRTKMRGLL